MNLRVFLSNSGSYLVSSECFLPSYECEARYGPLAHLGVLDVDVACSESVVQEILSDIGTDLFALLDREAAEHVFGPGVAAGRPVLAI